MVNFLKNVCCVYFPTFLKREEMHLYMEIKFGVSQKTNICCVAA